MKPEYVPPLLIVSDAVPFIDGDGTAELHLALPDLGRTLILSMQRDVLEMLRWRIEEAMKGAAPPH